ncbi:MAG: LLM class flavin-dependent oxidoreductase, partial [Anaerolineae bacterium]|nr:LLM class flavin-dependent oxidoreductase [Anaerolineae bacterium]
MKYAIYTPNFGPYDSPADLADMAREAEAAGWEGFFIWDHVAGWPHNIFDPWVTLTAIALATERLRFGCITPVPRRRPWKLARETASLDRLSGGRLTLIVGTGGGQAEWDDLGEETGVKTRGAMLDEGLDVLTGLWSGAPFSYAGSHYHIKEARFEPAPVQTPRIPIWVGGFWPNKPPFRRMARWDGMFPLFEVWEDEKVLPLLREALAYVQARRADPTLPFDVAVAGETP